MHCGKRLSDAHDEVHHQARQARRSPGVLILGGMEAVLEHPTA
jgi:hypothetical protein